MYAANSIVLLSLLGILLYEVVSFLWRAFSFKIAMAAVHLLCAGLVFSVLHFSVPLHKSLQAVKVKLLFDRYRACAEKAIEYAPGKSFSICDQRDEGTWYEIVVFDSEGEVTNHRSRRSTEFRNYPAQPYIVAYCDLEVTKLSGHFYLVGSSC